MKRIFNEALKEYCDRDYYPWHMPGHKRQDLWQEGEELLGMAYDVTEVPGLDNLHVPEGVIAESMAQLPEIYGSKKSYYLVNGSTGGILTAVSAVCNPGDTIIMSRNCHKAVYNIVARLDLKPVYLYPKVIEPYGICGSITPAQVERALKENPEAKAVIFPSPTYEGILSDVRKISEVVHQAGGLVIVDEAHGAHLEFGAGFPEAAVRCGADLVIESLHKTLPCYTQCAILHVGSIKAENVVYDELIERIERYLSVYQTSSPSYLFVANMENAIAAMEEWRGSRMAEYYARLKRYREKWSKLKWIHLLGAEEARRTGAFAYDEAKLVFCMPENTWTGEEFRKELEEQFDMVLEMASLNYVIAMTSVADTEAGYERLHHALQEMDRHVSECRLMRKAKENSNDKRLNLNIQMRENRGRNVYRENLVLLSGAALNKKSEIIPLSDAAGAIAGDYVTVYPPGIPVLVPGEEILASQRDYIEKCIQTGLVVHGIQWVQSEQNGKLPCIKKIVGENATGNE